MIFVEGAEMRIESLTKEDGKIIIKGNVKGVFLKEESEGKHRFFERLFG